MTVLTNNLPNIETQLFPRSLNFSLTTKMEKFEVRSTGSWRILVRGYVQLGDMLVGGCAIWRMCSFCNFPVGGPSTYRIFWVQFLF